MLLDKNDIYELDRIKRLNIINSITGIKPANLIGTKSKEGVNNVAIFSSVVHLGSQPAQLGLLCRPTHTRKSDTYTNITDTGYYTINQVSTSFVRQAHFTSAKTAPEVSEFDVMNLTPENLNDFYAPFVQQSSVKIGMKFLDEILLPNGCRLMIGSVELVELPDASVDAIGQIDLSSYDCAGISGLDSYYSLKKIESFPYVNQNVLEHSEFTGD